MEVVSDVYVKMEKMKITDYSFYDDVLFLNLQPLVYMYPIPLETSNIT
jgi:hypothetical protein